MELQDEKAAGASEPLSPPILYRLQGVACLVIILWGIGRASHLIVLVLLGGLLACSFLPLPEWLLRRFRFGKSAAIGLGAALLATLSLVTIFLLYERIPSFKAELPAYQERFIVLYRSVVAFLNGHGIHLGGASSLPFPSSERILELSRAAIPGAAGFLGDALLVNLLALIFLSAMVERPGAKRSALGETLRYYGGDVQRYISTSAKTNGIAALVNLALFLALGVKFALFWCVLSFVLLPAIYTEPGFHLGAGAAQSVDAARVWLETRSTRGTRTDRDQPGDGLRNQSDFHEEIRGCFFYGDHAFPGVLGRRAGRRRWDPGHPAHHGTEKILRRTTPRARTPAGDVEMTKEYEWRLL